MSLSAQQEEREIGRAGGIFAFFTFLSRILGLVRNQILSHYFGAGMVSDAFIAAFTIPNALRRLLGEGALTPAFVSVFTRELKGPRDSWHSFLSSTFVWLSLICAVVVVIGIVSAPALVLLYVPEFRHDPEKFELSIQLTRFLFPFLLLIAWAALFMGVLNSFRRFSLAAAGPAILNLCVIILVPLILHFFLPDLMKEQAIFIFGGAILVGAFLQLVIQIPSLKKLKAFPLGRFSWRDSRVAKLAWLLVPAIFSMGIHQLNIIVNRIFASQIEGAVSHLYYADLIIELPVALIATSLAVASVPSYSRLYSEGDYEGLNENFMFSCGINLMFAIPASLGCIVLASPLISTIFQTGAFEYQDTVASSRALIAYAIGLPFFCALRSLLPLYFAMKDTKSPAIAGAIALGVNFIAAWQFSNLFGSWGIALATSIASIVNFALLALMLLRHDISVSWKKLVRWLARFALAATFMALILYALVNELIPTSLWRSSGIDIAQIIVLSFLVLLGAILYLSLFLIWKVEAFEKLKAQIKKKWETTGS